MTKQDIEILLEIFIIIIGLYMAFFKSYFQEKGKNLATLEDIEEITEKVESIKTDFVRETEKLKLDLQYNNQVRFSLKSQELNSLVDFYEKYYLWLNVILDVYFSSYDETNYEKIKNIETNLNDNYFKFLLAEAKMELFILNEELITHSKEMKIKTLELQNYISMTAVKYKNILSMYNLVKNNTPAEMQIEGYAKFSEQQLSFLKDFKNQKLAMYKEIVPINIKFQSLCYNILLNYSE